MYQTFQWKENKTEDKRDGDLGVVRPNHSTLLNPGFEYIDNVLKTSEHYSLTYGASALRAGKTLLIFEHVYSELSLN